MHSMIQKFEKSARSLEGVFDFLQEKQSIDSLMKVLPIFLKSHVDKRRSPMELEADQREELKAMFDDFDLDGSGTLSATELFVVLERVGIEITPKQAQRLVLEVDDGELRPGQKEPEITFDQFSDFVARKEQQSAQRPAGAKHCRPAARACARHAPPPARRCYLALAWRATAVSTHRYFDRLVFFCIVVVGLATAVQLSFAPDEPLPPGVGLFLDGTQAVSLTVFTAEVVVKVVACGEAPLMYFLDPDEGQFNTFDFAIVVFSLVFALDPSTDGSGVAVGRLMRLVRVVLKIPELRYVLLGFLAGLNAVAPIMLLMTLIIYLYAVVGRVSFGENDPAHFGNMPYAMLSLFRVATVSGWGDIYAVNAYGCDRFDLYGSYFPTNTSGLVVRTGFGAFPAWGCVAPSAQPVVAGLFFYTFTMLTRWAVMTWHIRIWSRNN